MRLCDPRLDLLLCRAEGGAYLHANPEQAYVLSMPQDSTAIIDLAPATGDHVVSWIHIAIGRCAYETGITG
jgi:hypothetical protein